MMTHSITIRAPAKINLFLHILGQKPNGYHELQTLFQFIDLYDHLEIRPTTDGQIHFSSNDTAIPDEQQLVLKAARLLQTTCQCSLGAQIHLSKNIPMMAGLGGGSSDAASTLLALNAVWQCHLSLTHLQQLGLQLGADVPVFLHGHSAFAGGIGEQLQSANPPESWYVIAKPEANIHTAEVFGHAKLPRHTAAIQFDAYQYSTTRNDCEALVRQLHPSVEQACQYLSHYGQPRLTGTGACVFLPLTELSCWPSIQAQAPCPMWLCQGLNDSPAMQDLEDSDSRKGPNAASADCHPT